MWKGAINFGLVNIPVSLGVAVRPRDIHFHQVHDKDGGRIRQKRVCEVDGKEVPYEHVAKGYEISKGRVVLIGRDELKALDPVADKTISLEAFVPLDEIDPIYLEATYYVVPDAKVGAGAKAYTLFAAALEESERVALGRIVISTRQHMCILRAKDGQLVLTTMVYGDEVAEAPRVPKASASEKELELARALMQRMVGHFEPEKYEDEHRKRVEKLLAQKAAGKQLELPAEEAKVAPTHDLLEALQQSLAGGAEKKHAEPHRARARHPKRKRSA